ncbi:MAG: hypothetical protein NTY31_01965 [Candidatus Falkowbacteria bacterium]|nr:hypothetical protein [Candidatus Falkowbacteria bacterium]
MNLTLDELKPYFGGWLEIKKTNACHFQGGIRTLTITDGNILKIEFVWKMQFEGWPSKNPRWIHVPEFTEYNINLEDCSVPSWETVKEKTILLYFASADGKIIFHMANDMNPIKTLDTEGCPVLLRLELQKMKEQFLSVMDLSKISRVNFDLALIPIKEGCRFMRIDLKWQGAIKSFIRIQKNAEDNHARIYYGLLHEIAGQFSLTHYDIEHLMSDRGGGFLRRLEENNIEVWGSSSYFPGEPNHELTRSILREELFCQVS